MRSLSLLLLSALCCFPASGFAEAVFTNPVSGSTYYTTPLDACAAVIPQLQTFFAENNTRGLTIVFTVRSGQGAGTCLYDYVRSDAYTGTSASNNGSATSSAVKDRDCVVDEPTSIQWPLGPRDTSFPIYDVNPATATIPPWPVCESGCKATYVSVESCFAISDQTPLFMHCNYNAKRTGEACSTADTAPKPDTSKCPPGTVLSGSSCVNETPPDPCIADPTAPGCTTPPDPCIANPSGPGCPTDPGGGGTDPGGGGTKPGEGTGPGTGTQPEPGAAGGLACGDVFVCSGDSIACATAQLQKIEMCNGVRNSDYNGKGREVVADILKDPKGDLEEGEIHLASIISGHARFLPSSCPPAQSFTVYGRQFAFKNDLFCNFAISMSWLVVAMASLTAALYIGQSFGSS
jgi:hypothetical protein